MKIKFVFIFILLFYINNLSANYVYALAPNAEYAKAVQLYNQKNYRAATISFENCLKSMPTNVSVLYYCALSNQLSNNWARARQLYEYISAHFPQAREAKLANMALNQRRGGGNNSSYNSQNTGQANVTNYASSNNSDAYLDAMTPTSDLGSVPNEVRIPFTRRGNGVYVEATVNGQSISMHLDTGAPSTHFGHNHLVALGIARPAQGKIEEGLSGVGDRKTVQEWNASADIKLGPIYRRNFPITIQDDMTGEPLLGQTFLKPFYVTIDDDSKSVILRKKGTSSIASVTGRNSYSVPFRWVGGHMIVNAEICGKPYEMIFDTGADSVAFTMNDIKKLRIEMPDDYTVRRHIGTGGETTGIHFPISKIKLGPIVKEDIEVAVVQNSNMDRPLLGQSFFSDYQYTIDNEHNMIFFKPPK
jgi:clan AA aspartic protease (TIGR02281 family)